jgi:hypothetical protein
MDLLDMSDPCNPLSPLSPLNPSNPLSPLYSDTTQKEVRSASLPARAESVHSIIQKISDALHGIETGYELIQHDKQELTGALEPKAFRAHLAGLRQQLDKLCDAGTEAAAKELLERCQASFESLCDYRHFPTLKKNCELALTAIARGFGYSNARSAEITRLLAVAQGAYDAGEPAQVRAASRELWPLIHPSAKALRWEGAAASLAQVRSWLSRVVK